ncbi:uncharacterized protein LOC123530984 [Mercenaria mercenaria]|uniref:uncharacterized protein LOC123530984 n=1 Tax=Mercenaria mercenaria TaxID=6596 RepID=UPI00234E3EFF|nr:uncharacterized protein LOC123530984 [Mercenaria mercenaria]XP_053373412.1 uncharacterized protein LOC123530984 [Mercenaria mercenaria]
MLPAYQKLPPAIIAAREDEALTHGQVMYGLIKPTKDMSQIESTAAMVNVIPKKRIYRMENPEEIDLFMTEMMKRPLVLQPSAYIGRGLAVMRCTLYTKEERWVMMINQAHPKIFSRIKMGIETAKAKMDRGEPFILEISFNAYLKRVYLDRLTKAVLDSRFTFIDFEDAEIVIRYPGDRFHRGIQWEIQSKNKIRFEFEDLLPSDITRRTVMSAQTERNSPALRVIMPDELNSLLPGWDFENIDPLAGVMSSDEEEEEEHGAVGGYDPPSYEEQAFIPPAADGKVVGRARRKANQAAEKVVVPVELHVPERNGPQTLYPPSSPNRDRSLSSSHDYEKLNRKTGVPENPYTNRMVQNSGAPRSPRTSHPSDSPYETMNTTGKYGQHLSPNGPSSPRTHTPTSPRTPQTPSTPTTPRMPPSEHLQTQSPSGHRSPVTPRSAPSNDRYNTEYVNTRPSHQTYLTDDDDGGFSQHSPKSPQMHSGNMYDTNFNRNKPGMDRYDHQMTNGQNFDPRDRYANQRTNYQGPIPNHRGPSPNHRGPSTGARPDDLYRDRNSPSWRGPHQSSNRDAPIPLPRGFHRHQGSGRSDTSASDSGFGENENGVDSSNYRTDRNGGVNNDMHYSAKTPYYNRGFEKDSPEQEHAVVDDIMAKHKAMAAKLLKQQGQSVPNSSQRQEYYSDSNYNKELQKWRQNINDLERSCDDPDVEFSRSRLRMNSNGEPVEESFI